MCKDRRSSPRNERGGEVIDAVPAPKPHAALCSGISYFICQSQTEAGLKEIKQTVPLLVYIYLITSNHVYCFVSDDPAASGSCEVIPADVTVTQLVGRNTV